MLHGESLGLLVGAVALGAVHGVEPGHGWPVAASYALDQSNKWLYGFASSLILGIGHLISSIAMVAVFFYAKSYFSLTQVNEPITVVEGVTIGGPVSLVAGVLLILLGVREYYGGHSHDYGGNDDDHGHAHGDHADTDHSHSHGDHDDHGHAHADGAHSHGDHDQSHDHSHDHHDAHHERDDHDHHDDAGRWARIKTALPFVGGHSHASGDEAAERGLLGIAWFAFLLGFAHEEEFEIIALCAGSTHCLELMSAYALTVIAGIVGFTMLLVAGYEHYEQRVERYTPYLPAFSAAVLIVMGVGFVTGLF
jgi:nickel/cobalt exporter